MVVILVGRKKPAPSPRNFVVLLRVSRRFLRDFQYGTKVFLVFIFHSKPADHVFSYLP